MDRLPIIGLIPGLGALLGTQLLEGGHFAALLQGPAAVIVFVGTLGATLLSTSAGALRETRHATLAALRRSPDLRRALPGRFRDLAFRARKDGLVSLDREMRQMPSAFMMRALRHLIDGCDEQQLRQVLESDVETRQEEAGRGAEVLEIAGGYAPTMGILGAVLGLVRAMESLSNPEALGEGIAIAFIATIYGVGLANLVLLPLAARIRHAAERQEIEERMVIEGVLGLQAGIAPRMVERLLAARLGDERER